MKIDAQQKIDRMLSDIWGVEYVEPTEMEVEE